MPKISLEYDVTLPCQALSRINGVVICTALFDANSIVMIPRARTGVSCMLMMEFLKETKGLRYD
jgi:hypothetical protein